MAEAWPSSLLGRAEALSRPAANEREQLLPTPGTFWPDRNQLCFSPCRERESASGQIPFPGFAVDFMTLMMADQDPLHDPLLYM